MNASLWELFVGMGLAWRKVPAALVDAFDPIVYLLMVCLMPFFCWLAPVVWWFNQRQLARQAKAEADGIANVERWRARRTLK